MRLLESSKHIHVIRRTTANVDSNAPQNLTNASNGGGTGSTTRWNPNLILPYADGVNRDPTAALFHELCHAFEADRGVWDGILDPDTGIRYSEIQAIRTENAYRRAKGLAERKKYGRQDLPPRGAEDVAQTPPSLNSPDGLGCEDHGNPCVCEVCGMRLKASHGCDPR